MMRKREKGVPEFRSLEEEATYWEARGPLAEGHKGRVSKPQPGHKRSSFLVIRLTGEELNQLREVAAAEGLGPSTFTRRALLKLMERRSERAVQRINEAAETVLLREAAASPYSTASAPEGHRATDVECLSRKVATMSRQQLESVVLEFMRSVLGA